MNGFDPTQMQGGDMEGALTKLKQFLTGVGFSGSLSGLLRSLASASATNTPNGTQSPGSLGGGIVPGGGTLGESGAATSTSTGAL